MKISYKSENIYTINIYSINTLTEDKYKNVLKALFYLWETIFLFEMIQDVFPYITGFGAGH